MAIDLSLPVGTVAGGMSVSSSGAATYSIPLKVVPGTMGVEPQLSLEYNSQAGNGLLGWGWNMSGLSAVTRVGPDNYHDGKVAPIEWNGNDFYSLDGSRLTMLSGGGNIGSVFATESESWAKIETWGWLGSGPEFFTVVMKDGTFVEYGNSADSRLMNSAGTEVLSWKVSKTTDVNGNYMSFHYTNGGGEHRINEIWYTGSAPLGRLPYQRVKFNYAERSDPNTVYEGGSAYQSKYLLTEVVCYPIGANPVRTYSLGYKFADGYSFLQSVKECGTTGPCFNESHFFYGDVVELATKTDILELSSGYINPGVLPFNTQVGDFNGDGLSDVVQYTYEVVNGLSTITNLKVKKRNQGSSVSFTTIYTYPLPASYSIGSSTSLNSYNYHFSDFDGDGTDDILLERKTQNSLVELTIISKLQNSSPTIRNYFPPAIYGYFTTTPNQKTVMIGDFDGDGRSDFIISVASSTGCYKLFMTCPGIGIGSIASSHVNERVEFPVAGMTPDLNCPGDYIMEAYLSAPVDIDGDGKMEIMCIEKDTNGVSNTKVFGFNRKTPVGYTPMWEATKVYESGYPTRWHNVFFGDFNGDRKTDLLTSIVIGNSPALWQVATSNGKTFEVDNIPFAFNPSYSNHDPQNPNWSMAKYDDLILLSDFDGDGKTDILHKKLAYWAGEATFKCYYSRGQNKWKSQTATLSENSWSDRQLFGNFSGDGRAELLNIDDVGDCQLFTFGTVGKNKLLLKSRDGVGLVSSVKYERLNSADPYFYTFSGNTTYPFNTLNIPYYAVSQTWTNEYPLNLKNYSYKDLRYHKGGKGLIGFNQTEITDVGANTKTTQKVLEWDIINNHVPNYFVPKVTESSVTSTASGLHTPLNKTTSYFITTPITNIFNFRFKRQLDAVKTEDLLQGTYTSKRFWYDGWGNATKIASEVNGYLEEDIEEITYAPAGNTSTPVPSKPETILKTHKRTDLFAVPVSLKTRFTYLNGRLTQKKEFDNLSVPIVTHYSYNTVGLLTNTLVAAAGAVPRTSAVTYDFYFRAPLTKTNALGQTASTTYDYGLGVPLTQTGIDNLTVSFEYDSYGRRTKTTVPGPANLVTTEGYSWNSSFSDVRYYQNVTQPGQGTAKTGYDVQGREIETRKSMWGTGNAVLWSSTTKTYNAINQVLSETAPRFASEPAVTTTYSYDYLNRPATVTTPTNTLTYNYIYGAGATGKNLRVEITDVAGRKTAKETDPAGKVVESTTEGGKLQYSYDSWGNAVYTTVGTAPSYVTVTLYDAYNRRFSTTESSAGNTQYTYNGFGELITERDALYKTTTTGYDVLGRVVQRTGPEGTTTYQYGPAGTSGAGKLKKIIGFNSGDQTENFYDAWGRLTRISETQNSQVYNTTYTYDWANRLATTTYPNSGPLISNLYNEHGLLTTVLNGTSTIYTSQSILYNVQSINGRGQTLTATRANGLTTTNSYQNDALTHTITPGTGANMVQDYALSYDWDRGLIKTRQEKALTANKAESFSYDNAGRFKSLAFFNPATPSIPVPTIQSIDYGSGGSADNIVVKSDVGQFKYIGGKIHALSYTDNAATQVSTQTQKVSYTPFHRPDSLMEGDWLMTFAYGPDYERRRTDLYKLGTLTERRHYFGSGSERHENVTTGTSRDLFYIPAPDGLAAIMKREGSVVQLYFPYADHLGSVTSLTDELGNVVCRQAFDPWGRRRNPGSLLIDDNALPASYAWLRGFTGHEHLPQFKLINMNARLYDPLLGRMLSPDNYVTDASNAMTYNLFSYANNNPISYVDPDGNNPFAVAAVIYFVFFTDMGYQAQKYVLPVAFKVDWHFGSEKVGIGFDASVGTPKLLSFGQPSDRWSYGKTYFDHTYGGYSGWETREGKESSTWLGMYSNEVMKYSFNTSDGEFNQTIGTKSYGFRGVYSFEISNDLNEDGYNGDGGDRWRTAAGRISAGPFELGLNLFTGDPGPPDKRLKDENDGPWGTYVASPFGDPDKHRSGGLYFGAFGLRVGWNSESIRNFFQNKMVHDKKEIARFKNLGGSGSPLFQFGSGGIW